MQLLASARLKCQEPQHMHHVKSYITCNPANCKVLLPACRLPSFVHRTSPGSCCLHAVSAPRHPAATEDASLRWQAFQSGANMVTRCSHALLTALQQVAQQQLQLQQPAAHQPPSCSCDWCGLPDLSPAEYWQHQQLYHINHPNMAGRCQMCGR